MKFTSESSGWRPRSRRFDHKSSPPATGITILAVFGFLLVAGEGASISSAAEQGPVAAVSEPGFESLFDGRTLDGWQGDRAIWSVQDGAITGRTAADTGLKENNFLIWRDPVEDFELRLKFRLENGNSGIYYRARKRPADQTKGDPLIGTQADFDASGRWTGVIMEYLLRGVLAERGQRVVIDPEGNRQITSIGDPAELLQAFKLKDWNDYTVTAKGGSGVLAINGVTMCELDDRDPRRLVQGWLALQVHVGPPMQVQFKEIYLRRLAGASKDEPTG
jgi:hypothetical protein